MEKLLEVGILKLFVIFDWILALSLKEIDYETHSVNLLKDENQEVIINNYILTETHKG